MIEIGLTEVADLVKLVPNATFTSNFGSSQLFVRGIGNTFITAGGDPGVATYNDGSYISDQTSANASLFDLQRIEVLRGPQGALYGRNATGGAMFYAYGNNSNIDRGNNTGWDFGILVATGFFFY